jgi:hypothetical protein
MQLVDHFDVLLKDTVNLNQTRLDQLQSRVDAVFLLCKLTPITEPTSTATPSKAPGLTAPSFVQSVARSSMPTSC